MDETKILNALRDLVTQTASSRSKWNEVGIYSWEISQEVKLDEAFPRNKTPIWHHIMLGVVSHGERSLIDMRDVVEESFKFSRALGENILVETRFMRARSSSDEDDWVSLYKADV